MQLTSEQRIKMVANYLKTRSFKEDQQLIERLFRSGRTQDLHKKILIFFEKSLPRIQEYQPEECYGH